MPQTVSLRPQVAMFECSACGETHHNTGGLPVGWSATAGSAWCGSCTALGIPARDLREARKTRRAA